MEQFNLFYANGLGISPLLIGVVAIWVLFWKGCSLWIAAKGGQEMVVSYTSYCKYFRDIRNHLHLLCRQEKVE